MSTLQLFVVKSDEEAVCRKRTFIWVDEICSRVMVALVNLNSSIIKVLRRIGAGSLQTDSDKIR